MMIWFLLSLGLNLGAHDFHVSKCEVNLNEQGQALEMILHIYTDDLELAILQNQQQELKLFSQHEHAEADDQIVDYLSSEFLLVANEADTLYWTYLGREMTEDLSATLIYLEVPEVANLESLSITNSILIDTYDDQKNMLQCRRSGTSVGYHMMVAGDVEYRWKF